MASPLSTAKKSVDLSAERVPGSRIRRDPPPAQKPKSIDITVRNARDVRGVLIGIPLVALAVAIILFGFAGFAGWSPSQIHLFF